MSVSGIRDGLGPDYGTDYRIEKILPGDLVVVSDHFVGHADYDMLKSLPGIVTRFISKEEVPPLLEVFWPDGALEIMYLDEVDPI